MTSVLMKFLDEDGIERTLPEGASNNLFFPWKRNEKWHVVAAFIEFLPLKRFQHISVDNAYSALAEWGIRFECRREPAHISDTQFCNVIGTKFGLWCSNCKKIIKDDPSWIKGYAWWWQDHEACKACAVSIVADILKYRRKLEREAATARREKRNKFARLEKDAADLGKLIRGVERKYRDGIGRHRRCAGKNVSVVAEAGSGENQSHGSARSYRVRADRS